ncbi:hypothetical protein ACT3S3_13600 [Corynebacterium sp. AOP40-4SA-5]
MTTTMSTTTKKFAVSACLTMTVMAGGVATAAADDVSTPTIGSAEGIIWNPSHDEDLRNWNVCSGPAASWEWLLANFRDHGADIRESLSPNSLAELIGLPIRLLVQIPVYAIQDTLFHLPTTIGDILSYCSSARPITSGSISGS